jgi:hypothetical protein
VSLFIVFVVVVVRKKKDDDSRDDGDDDDDKNNDSEILKRETLVLLLLVGCDDVEFGWETWCGVVDQSTCGTAKVTCEAPGLLNYEELTAIFFEITAYCFRHECLLL